MNESRIQHVTLHVAGTFGATAEVKNSLYFGDYIASKPYKVFFDQDDRFLRVECDRTTHLVPLTNVASITLAQKAA